MLLIPVLRGLIDSRCLLRAYLRREAPQIMTEQPLNRLPALQRPYLEMKISLLVIRRHSHAIAIHDPKHDRSFPRASRSGLRQQL